MTTQPDTVTPLRAIDLPCNDHCASDQQWFFTEDLMRQYLAGQRAAYANVDGMVRDAAGEVIGLWYFAQLSAKHPDFDDPQQMSVAEHADLLSSAEDLRDYEVMRGNVLVNEMSEEAIAKQMAQEALEFDEDLKGWLDGVNHPESTRTEPKLDSEEAFQITLGELAAKWRRQHGLPDVTGWGKALDREVLEDAEPIGLGREVVDDYDESLTEDERMGQAGMSDEDIAGVHFIEKLNTQLDEARECIGSLLAHIDDNGGRGMHLQGQTPDWYVEAAAISCGIELPEADEGDHFMADVRTHELMEEACGQLLKAPGHISLTIDARRAAKLEGNCEEGYVLPTRVEWESHGDDGPFNEDGFTSDGPTREEVVEQPGYEVDEVDYLPGGLVAEAIAQAEEVDRQFVESDREYDRRLTAEAMVEGSNIPVEEAVRALTEKADRERDQGEDNYALDRIILRIIAHENFVNSTSVIKTPTELREKAEASFMAGLKGAIDAAKRR